MSISGLFLGTRALSAHQIALEVTGQNISNVNNPDYTRQRAHMMSTTPLNYSFGQLGTGVKVGTIEQVRDAFIDTEIRRQQSKSSGAFVVSDIYDRIETIFNDTSQVGLNTLIGDFFDSLEDLSLSPEEIGVREVVTQKGTTLAGQINFLNNRLDQLRMDMNTAVVNGVTEINTLTQQIADLNKEIVKVEAGGIHTANDLKDQREGYIRDLAQLSDLQISEMSSGEVNISIDGFNVVFGGTSTQLGTNTKAGDELPVVDVVINGSSTVIDFTGGEMYGYLQSRDTNIVSAIDDLDELARTIIDEFNKIHVDGRGLQGFTSLTSANFVSDATAALDNAGLDITPNDTSFDIITIDETTGAEVTTTISVDASADSLTDVANAINAIANLNASVTADNKLQITSDSGYSFAFSNVTDDNSNFLSAIGINTFFTGYDAESIAVNSTIKNNAQYFAAALSSSPGDNLNVKLMAELRNGLVADSSSKTIEEFYQSNIVQLASNKSDSEVQYEGADTYLTKLQLKRESISGVNLDEEAANLILFQRGYEAAARYISVMDQVLNTLVNGLI